MSTQYRKPDQIIHPWQFGDGVENKIFKDWHNTRYLRQCLYNLQEKYDCGGIPKEEWDVISKKILKDDKVWK